MLALQLQSLIQMQEEDNHMFGLPHDNKTQRCQQLVS